MPCKYVHIVRKFQYHLSFYFAIFHDMAELLDFELIAFDFPVSADMIVLPDNTLVLTGVVTNSSDIYSCVATNEAGVDTKNFSITVEGESEDGNGVTINLSLVENVNKFGLVWIIIFWTFLVLR